jgi:hypothetical protein
MPSNNTEHHECQDQLQNQRDKIHLTAYHNWGRAGVGPVFTVAWKGHVLCCPAVMLTHLSADTFEILAGRWMKGRSSSTFVETVYRGAIKGRGLDV